MTTEPAERWLRMESIFYEARELDAAARAAFLTELGDQDKELHDEIVQLLAADEESPDALPVPTAGAALAADVAGTDNGSLQAGRTIGAYRLVEHIGSGGMGTVWLAERSDEHFRRQVAIKLIRRCVGSGEILARFRQERQVLANLDHPHIARLLDGGATDDGLPYLVMEFVQGVPIDTYCHDHALSIRRRLELFLKVCDAVAFAHRNLVVHRDLKPANVLIQTTNGADPKLLDFGIAKVLAPGDQPGEPDATGAGPRFLTPRYASPEQVRNEPTTTQTDVYSLGVMLYELLTGRPPYELTTRSHQEIERTICEEIPGRPSTKATAAASPGEATIRRWRRELRGDLDTIVLMAIRKERARRYASVEQLSEDIRRHLDGRTVVARPDTLLYRTSRFVRRNRVSVAAGFAVLLVLVVGLVSSVTQWKRAEAARLEESHQRAAAESEAYRAGMNAAESALRAGDVTGAAESLERTPERLRGWEWRHLSHRLDRSLATFTHPSGLGFNCVALSPDETTVIAGDLAGVVHVFDASTSRFVRSFGRHRDPVRALAFSPDGTTVATGSGQWTYGRNGDGTIRLWDLASGELIASLSGHRDAVQTLTFDAAGTHLVSGSSDGTVRVWEVASRRELHRLDAHDLQVQRLAWSPGGTEIASAGWDSTVARWDTSSWSRLGTLRSGSRDWLWSVAYSADGARIAAGDTLGRIWIWDRATGGLVDRLSAHDQNVYDVRFHDDGRLVSFSKDGTLRVWAADPSEGSSTLLGHAPEGTGAVMSRGGRIYTSSTIGTLRAWSIDAADVPAMNVGSWVWGVDVSPDGGRIAAFAEHGVVVGSTAAPSRTRTIDLPGANAGAWSPDGARFVAGNSVHDAATGAKLFELDLLSKHIWSDRYSPDGSMIATASWKRDAVRLWHAHTGEPIGAPIVLKGREPNRIRFTPDGTALIVGYRTGEMSFWNVDTRRQLTEPHVDYRDQVRGLDVSRDGALLVSASAGVDVVLWDVASRRPTGRLVGHSALVSAVAISPDGTRIATGDLSGRIKLWDPQTRREVGTLHGHSDRVLSLVFTSDGCTLVSGSADRRVRIWETAPPAQPR